MYQNLYSLMDLNNIDFGTAFLVFAVILLIVVFAFRSMLLADKRERRLEKILRVWDQRIDPDIIEQLVTSKEVRRDEFENELVVLQIEAHRFFQARDPRLTELAFYTLGQLLNKELIPMIRQQGGFIVESEEFCVFAVFGLSPFKQHPGLNSKTIEQAFFCAQSLQNRLLNFCSEMHKKLMPIVPLSFFLDVSRFQFQFSTFDFWVDQRHLHDAKQKMKPYVASAGDFLVLMAEEVYNSVNLLGKNFIYPKLICPAVDRDPIRCYEYIDEALLLEKDQLVQAYNSFVHFHRRDERYKIAKKFPIKVSVRNLNGSGRLVNFSRNGLMVELDHCLGRTSVIALNFSSDEQQVQRAFEQARISECKAEVRFGSLSKASVFHHGLKIIEIKGQDVPDLLFRTLLPFKS